MDDIYELAADHRQLMREKEEEKMRTEAEKLQHILEEGDRQSAINASINILKKSCPSALNPEYLTENKE